MSGLIPGSLRLLSLDEHLNLGTDMHGALTVSCEEGTHMAYRMKRATSRTVQPT